MTKAEVDEACEARLRRIRLESQTKSEEDRRHDQAKEDQAAERRQEKRKEEQMPRKSAIKKPRSLKEMEKEGPPAASEGQRPSSAQGVATPVDLQAGALAAFSSPPEHEHKKQKCQHKAAQETQQDAAAGNHTHKRTQGTWNKC